MFQILVIVALIGIWYELKRIGPQDGSGDESLYESKYKPSQVPFSIRIKKWRAQSLGIPELFECLYFKHLRYYPSWISTPRNHAYVCSVISNAVQLDPKTIQITFGGKSYDFKFVKESMSSIDCSQFGTLSLLRDGRILLILKTELRSVRPPLDSYWQVCDVEGFVGGDWIKEFQMLEQNIRSEERKRMSTQTKKLQAEEQEKLKTIKRNFGGRE